MIITNTNSAEFTQQFEELLNRGKMDIAHVSSIVGSIIDEIKENKNSAVRSHIAKFDKWTPQSDSDLKIDAELMKQAYEALDGKLKCEILQHYFYYL